ncbi:MAG TPA: DHA2 family efflux MFS transporter permease subunit [Thermoplasmata archaeon]|nr:DHA2 family efflux MFS transporter permease subunit [Thermoplasmata archaeon]HZY92213.1 DHA2 family efflux MFS transporter permease subunit [Thermoplasmata archaeon]
METTAPAPSAGGSSAHPQWVLALTGLGIFMVVLDGLVVVTALPLIHAEVGGDIAALQWILSAYLLAFGAGIVTASSLGDRFGRRQLFVLGLVLFSVSSAGCALAPTISWLIAARTVQGIGAAFVTPLSLSLLMAAFPPARRGAVLGLWGGIAGVAVAAGPLVGGGLTQALSWHWIFWINVPIGLAAAVLSSRFIDESLGPDRHVDLPGAALITSSSVGLLWGLTRGNAAGWTSTETVLALGLGAVLFAAFVLWERRTAAPMVPLGLFRNRTFAAANAIGFLSLGALLSAAVFMSQYYQLVLGYSPFAAGLRFLPWTATPLVVAPLAGRLVDRIGSRPLMVIGLSLQALGFALVVILATATTSYTTLAAPLTLAGVGISLVLPSAPAAAFGAVEPRFIGKASGVFNSMQRFGGAFVLAIASAAFATVGQLGPPSEFLVGFRWAMGVSIAFSIVGAVLALGVSRPVLRAVTVTAPSADTARSGTL